jgi:uncharacterized membrane protein
MRLLCLAALALAILSAALASGFFFAFQAVVMPGLAAADPAVATRAMQAVNAAVRNAGFAFGFFGPLAFGALAAVLCGAMGQWPASLLAASAWAVYAGGVLAVTSLVNVPLNQALATETLATVPAAAAWSQFSMPWTVWNAVRTLAAVLALAGFVGALLAAWRPARVAGVL